MEESGIVILKASQEVEAVFKAGNKIEALDALQEYSGMDDEVFIRNDALYDSVEFKDGYIILNYDASYEWSGACADFIKQANNIEFYAVTSDEYGQVGHFALNAEGERVAITIEQGGESLEYESVYKESKEALDKWNAIIPDAVRKLSDAFEAADIDDFMF